MKRFALVNDDLKFFGNVWSNQEVTSLQLAHGPVLASEAEEILGYLFTKKTTYLLKNIEQNKT